MGMRAEGELGIAVRTEEEDFNGHPRPVPVVEEVL